MSSDDEVNVSRCKQRKTSSHVVRSDSDSGRKSASGADSDSDVSGADSDSDVSGGSSESDMGELSKSILKKVGERSKTLAKRRRDRKHSFDVLHKRRHSRDQDG